MIPTSRTRTLTIFIQLRVYDFDGPLHRRHRDRPDGRFGTKKSSNTSSAISDIYFADADGRIILGSNAADIGKPLASLAGMETLAERILAARDGQHRYSRNGQTMLLNARLIPELQVASDRRAGEDDALTEIRRSLYLNLLIVVLIAAASIWATGVTIGRYQRRLEEMAVTDKLTGIANRQAFAPLMEQLLSELRRTPQALSLLLIDVDHFKAGQRHARPPGR